MTGEVVITGMYAASPPPSSPPHPPSPLPPSPVQQAAAAWPPCDGTHAALLQHGNPPRNRPAAADFTIRDRASVAAWLPQPLTCGLHMDVAQLAPLSIAGAPARVKVWPSYAAGIWTQPGLSQDAFVRAAWDLVAGRREGRSFKSGKLTAMRGDDGRDATRATFRWTHYLSL
jgi:hypothetical protein